MKKHDCYFEITADTPYNLGLQLGRALGPCMMEALGKQRALAPRENGILAATIAETERRYPQYIEELKGYAAGAGVPFDALWRLSLEDDMAPLEKCTTIIANGGRFLAHNDDWEGSAARVCILKRTLGNEVIFEIHYAGTLGGNGVSITSKGLVQVINSHRIKRTDWDIPLIPTNVAARAVLDGGAPDRAAGILESMQRIGGSTHILLDMTGVQPLRAVESSHDQVRILPVDSFPFAHTNYYLSPDFAHLNTIVPPDVSSSWERHATATCNAKPHMTPQDAMAVLSDTSKGNFYSLLNDDTTASIILDLNARTCLIHVRLETDKGWIEYPLDFVD